MTTFSAKVAVTGNSQPHQKQTARNPLSARAVAASELRPSNRTIAAALARPTGSGISARLSPHPFFTKLSQISDYAAASLTSADECPGAHPRAGDVVMPSVWKSSFALQRKRLASALIAASLCVLIGACSNDATDDHAANTSTPGSADSLADHGNPAAMASANPSQAESASPPLTIQTPALSASNPGAKLSTTATAPLATPVIHTVD
jgi:hypothetical protein